MLHRVGLAPTISVHARWEVIAGSSRALLLKLPVHGAGERARTVDLLITNQLLCLLSYTSIKTATAGHASILTVPVSVYFAAARRYPLSHAG